VMSAEDFASRLLDDCVGAMELLSIHLGLELGAYPPLVDGATQDELASAAGIAPRYAQEWLEQQVAAGIVRCDDASAAPGDRTYRLPAEHAAVLLDDASGVYAGPLAMLLAGLARAVPRLPAAMRSGGGVPFGAYGAEIRRGIAALNAPGFRDDLVPVWLSTMPDVVERLRSGPARILDLGCGEGASAIAMALGFPQARVLGIDLDEPSVRSAAEASMSIGLADRVAFEVADAVTMPDPGPFALVTIFEALHDMGDPVGVLAAVRSRLEDTGVLLVADERVADTFTDEPTPAERLQYGFSVLHCLPATMAEEPVVAAGTVLRAPTVMRWATEAGFSCTRLPVEHEFWQFYRLDA